MKPVCASSSTSYGSSQSKLPARFGSGWPALLIGLTLSLALSLHALILTEFFDLTWSDFLAIPVNTGRLLHDMLPPDLSILPKLLPAIIETLQMSLVGTVFGVLLSLPLGLFAARNLSPHPIIYHSARMMIGVARSVPDLVWAIFLLSSSALAPLPVP
jgi:phosphonate transport system permease protein